MAASKRKFGVLADQTTIEAMTLQNANGVSATVITYGATLQSLTAPDRAGQFADIVLGYADAAAYEQHGNYLGASIGRFANRIGKGRFSLDGKAYQLQRNDKGASALHGGPGGFDRRVWGVADHDARSVTLSYESPDGEEGYPGCLSTTVTYSLDDENQLTIAYVASTDRPTIVNLTHHALFNMAGEGAASSALSNVLQIDSDGYCPVDEELIPTGEVRPVEASAFDFRNPRTVGERIRDAHEPQLIVGRGYDHNYALNGKAGGPPRLIARLADPTSGRAMEILSDQPGVQFYAGNVLDGATVGKSGRMYRQGDGVALEPQLFPDTPNKPQFGSARLDPGDVYRNTMVLRLTTTED